MRQKLGPWAAVLAIHQKTCDIFASALRMGLLFIDNCGHPAEFFWKPVDRFYGRCNGQGILGIFTNGHPSLFFLWQIKTPQWFLQWFMWNPTFCAILLATCHNLPTFHIPSSPCEKRQDKLFSCVHATLQEALSVRGLVSPPVGPWTRVEKCENERFRCFFVYVKGAWGMDGGRMPLPTHPQRYCDPTSLV